MWSRTGTRPIKGSSSNLQRRTYSTPGPCRKGCSLPLCWPCVDDDGDVGEGHTILHSERFSSCRVLDGWALPVRNTSATRAPFASPDSTCTIKCLDLARAASVRLGTAMLNVTTGVGYRLNDVNDDMVSPTGTASASASSALSAILEASRACAVHTTTEFARCRRTCRVFSGRESSASDRTTVEVVNGRRRGVPGVSKYIGLAAHSMSVKST